MKICVFAVALLFVIVVVNASAQYTFQNVLGGETPNSLRQAASYNFQNVLDEENSADGLQLKQRYEWIPPVKKTVQEQLSQNEQVLQTNQQALQGRETELADAKKRVLDTAEAWNNLKQQKSAAEQKRDEAVAAYSSAVAAQQEAQRALNAAKEAESAAEIDAQNQTTLLERDTKHAAINKQDYERKIEQFNQIYTLLGTQNQVPSSP